ncbi:hypothetical protein GCM10010423_70330 [Streptomyces levis]|uniref:Uncharacterized protein n=1 Tax=Streptomyces levis TaxID=285566 RepID=A0ABN3P3Z9_9ACTN
MPRRPPQCDGLCHGPDGAEVRTILLDTVVHLAPPLRRAPPGSPRLNPDLTLKFAGDGRGKTSRLVEPSAHADDLCAAAFQLTDAVGLQRRPDRPRPEGREPARC